MWDKKKLSKNLPFFAIYNHTTRKLVGSIIYIYESETLTACISVIRRAHRLIQTLTLFLIVVSTLEICIISIEAMETLLKHSVL